MQGFQRILVGVALTEDGAAVTPGSRRAALQAQWLAEQIRSSLTFVHSCWSDESEDREAARAAEVRGKDVLDALLAIKPEGFASPIGPG